MQDVIGWIGAGIAVVLCAVLLIALGSVLQTLQATRRSLRMVERRMLPLLDELEGTVRRAGSEVDHIDEVLGSVAAVSRTLEDASNAASSAVKAPVVKVLAFSAGTRTAYHRFRRRRTVRR